LVIQAAKLVAEGCPKAIYPVITELASQGLLGQAMLPHPWRGRLGVLDVAAPLALAPPAPVRLADRAGRGLHADSRGTDGWGRVNAELGSGTG
jgi:hypothetical protein